MSVIKSLIIPIVAHQSGLIGIAMLKNWSNSLKEITINHVYILSTVVNDFIKEKQVLKQSNKSQQRLSPFNIKATFTFTMSPLCLSLGLWNFNQSSWNPAPCVLAGIQFNGIRVFYISYLHWVLFVLLKLACNFLHMNLNIVSIKK